MTNKVDNARTTFDNLGEKRISASCLHRFDGSASFAVDNCRTIFFLNRLDVVHGFAETEKGVDVIHVNFPAHVARRHDEDTNMQININSELISDMPESLILRT